MSDVFRYNTNLPDSSLSFTEEKSSRFVTNPNPSGIGLLELIKDVPNAQMIEIGTDVGDTSHFLLSHKSDLTIYSVDPYSNYIDWNSNNLNERDDVYDFMMDRMQGFGERFIQIRETSDAAVNDLHDFSESGGWQWADLVFVDGIHTYEQVAKDCRNYWPFCKPGGIFAGHDYNAIEGVRRAVDELSETVKLPLQFTNNDVWYIRR